MFVGFLGFVVLWQLSSLHAKAFFPSKKKQNHQLVFTFNEHWLIGDETNASPFSCLLYDSFSLIRKQKQMSASNSCHPAATNSKPESCMKTANQRSADNHSHSVSIILPLLTIILDRNYKYLQDERLQGKKKYYYAWHTRQSLCQWTFGYEIEFHFVSCGGRDRSMRDHSETSTYPFLLTLKINLHVLFLKLKINFAMCSLHYAFSTVVSLWN